MTFASSMNSTVGAVDVLFHRALADTDAIGDRLLGFFVDPEATKNILGPFRQLSDRSRHSSQLLPRRNDAVGGRCVVDFGRDAKVASRPLLLTVNAPQR